MTARPEEALLARLDGTGSRRELAAIEKLKRMKPGLAYWLLQRYRTSSSWKVRRACVYYAYRSARGRSGRDRGDAITLAREAIRDRSRLVLYRACELLAYAQRMEVLPDLRAVLAELRDGAGSDDVRAAIDAIEGENRHWFLDREHTGKMRMYTLDEFLEILEAGRRSAARPRPASSSRKRSIKWSGRK